MEIGIWIYTVKISSGGDQRVPLTISQHWLTALTNYQNQCCQVLWCYMASLGFNGPGEVRTTPQQWNSTTNVTITETVMIRPTLSIPSIGWMQHYVKWTRMCYISRVTIIPPMYYINRYHTSWIWTVKALLPHDNVIKWKHFPRYWPCVRGIHRSPMESPHKGQWRFDVFFDLRLNKRLSKHSRRRWFEMPSGLLWHHCNDREIFHCMRLRIIQISGRPFLIIEFSIHPHMFK